MDVVAVVTQSVDVKTRVLDHVRLYSEDRWKGDKRGDNLGNCYVRKIRCNRIHCCENNPRLVECNSWLDIGCAERTR